MGPWAWSVQVVGTSGILSRTLSARSVFSLSFRSSTFSTTVFMGWKGRRWEGWGGGGRDGEEVGGMGRRWEGWGGGGRDESISCSL